MIFKHLKSLVSVIETSWKFVSNFDLQMSKGQENIPDRYADSAGFVKGPKLTQKLRWWRCTYRIANRRFFIF